MATSSGLNQIAVIRNQNYPQAVHFVFILDGIPLDQWLEAKMLGYKKFTGLVPTLGHLEHRDEETVAWQSLLPLPGCSRVAPVLICPEHRDFSCLVVMAEVFHGEHEVSWLRLGLNSDSAAGANDIGHSVEWLPDLAPLVFEKQAYLACLEQFHLLRLNKTLRFEGKTLALLLMPENESQPEHVLCSYGKLCLTETGLMMDRGENAMFALRSEWLTLIRSVDPEISPLFENADFYLPLPLKKLSAETLLALGAG